MAEHTHIEELKALVESSAGFAVDTSRQFEQLHEQMQHRIGEAVGVSTLKRLWGYIDGYESVRESTLDVLCRFVGFPDWHTFVADHCGAEDQKTSHRIVTATLSSAEVSVDDRVAIEWNPGRRLLLLHKGEGLYEVLEAHNSKLAVGDTFHCERFMLCQPLYVDSCVHAGLPPAPFVMGKQGGLTKIERL